MFKNISASVFRSTQEDNYIACNCSSSAVKVVLPSLPNDNQNVTIKKTDSSANAITVVPYGSQFLEGTTNQVETATVIGDITGTGDATVVVTCAAMLGSPLTVSVPVVSGDAIAVTAENIRNAFRRTTNITDIFTISGTAANIVLTQIEPSGNDATTNISIDNGTCTGLTTAATSTDTTAGVAITISTQYEYITFVNNGSSWVMLDKEGINETETLVNKTLTSPTLTTPKIATSGSINDAGGDEYIVFTEASTPKTYIGINSGNTTIAPQVRGAGETNTGLLLAGTGTGKVTIGDGVATNKALNFELVGATATKTMTILSSHTDDRTLTIPDATDTLVGKATTDTMTNKTLTTPVIASVYQDAGKTKLMTIPDTASDTLAAIAATQTFTNKTLDSAGTGNYLKNVVLAYAGSITRAEMVSGKTLIAATASRQIKVLSVKLGVVGAFDGGAGTSFILQDTNDTPIVILTALKAALTTGAKISTEGLAIANVSEGVGMTAALTASKGIAVAPDAAWDAGTNIDIVLQYMYV